jgi:AraC-like DNA-binding protein
MANRPSSSDKQAVAKLLSHLKPFAATKTRIRPGNHAPPFMSAFVIRRREVLSELLVTAPGLIIVIEGRKEVVSGAQKRIYGPGSAFVLRAGSRIDVVNEPDAKTGVYRALFLHFSRELMIEAARLWPALRSVPLTDDPSVVIDKTLCSALINVSEAIESGLAVSRRVVDHRVLEILLILVERGAFPLRPKYMENSVAEAVRLLIRHRLDHPWTAAAIAHELSISPATLRRRLRNEGQSLRGLLRAERMKGAHLILSERHANVGEAVAAAGYASRSHFTRRFREAFGRPPSKARRRSSGVRTG